VVATPSTMLPLGTVGPDFELPDADGRVYALSDFAGAPVLVVAFLCNHCPYVEHIRDRLADVGDELERRGVPIVGINSNAVDSHPEDTPALMRREPYRFPYLSDETQAVAKAYSAACTPDFFVFGADRTLVYRGQFDDSRPSNDVPVTGADLVRAVDAGLSGAPAPEPQRPSMGCNVKWKPGNAPDYFP
jgi:peroxiredoxin